MRDASSATRAAAPRRDIMRAMRKILVALMLAALPFVAAAQERAFTNRATDLKERAATESKTIAALPQETPVKVLARGGGWTQVEATGQQGWVRVFHLRFPAVAEASTSGSAGTTLAGIGSALGLGRPAPRAPLASTGVRGLSPEDLKNADPNPEALRRLESWRADRAAAEGFAREGKLVEAHVDELPGAPR